ncbi:MAG: type IV secretory system conjugative DNA transfer family protein [Bacteroidota bacterium]
MRNFFGIFIKAGTAFIYITYHIFKFVLSPFFRFSRDAQPKPKPYQASFGSRKNLLSKRHHGFRLTGRENISAQHSHQNAMIIGGTGTGKSSVVLIPSLLSMHGSFVVHDPSGELHATTCLELMERGYKVKVLNFGDGSLSRGFNPLFRATTGAEINKVASMIIRTSFAGKSDPFWDLQGVNLLRLVIHLVKGSNQYESHLTQVRELIARLSHDSKSLEADFAELGRADLLNEYQAFQAFDDKVRLGVIATVMSALQVFSDEQVAQVTAKDTLNLQKLRQEKTALFIQTPVTDQAYYATLSAIFFEQLFATLLQHMPQYDDRDVFCLLDEASSLYIPSLSIYCANCRKYRVGILLALQDFAQLVERYGHYDAETIKSNCFAKLYFTGQSLATCKELEAIVGKFEYMIESGTQVVRPLLTSDEIRTMPKDQALLLLGHFKPLQVKLHPYYQKSLVDKLLKN